VAASLAAIAGALLFATVAGSSAPAPAGDAVTHAPTVVAAHPQIYPTSTVVPPEEQYEGDTSDWPYMALAAFIPVLVFGGFIILFRRYSRPRE